MRRFRWLVVALSIAGALSLSFDGARAEGFVDVYAGAAFTGDATGSQVGPLPGMAGSGKVRFEDSLSVGGRAGYWLDSIDWLGFALDASYFNPDQDINAAPLELDVIPISALLMLRAPLLKDSDFPRGRLQPYGGIGPSAFVTDASLDFRKLCVQPPPALCVPPPGAREFSDTTVEVGLDVRAGVRFRPLRSREAWAIFVEYRYTQFDLEFEDAGIEIETQLDTNHITAGVGFHF